MRIISGKYRGKKLQSLSGNNIIRPTLDMAKESIFNILNSHIKLKDIKVLDCFAGSGALGIESLSRGAKEVIFIEKSKEAALIIKSNLNGIKEAENCKILNKDIFQIKEGLKEQDLVFLDPPYHQNLIYPAILHLKKIKVLTLSSVLVIESDIDEELENLDNILQIMDIRRYAGSKFIFSKVL